MTFWLLRPLENRRIANWNSNIIFVFEYIDKIGSSNVELETLWIYLTTKKTLSITLDKPQN